MCQKILYYTAQRNYTSRIIIFAYTFYPGGSTRRSLSGHYKRANILNAGNLPIYLQNVTERHDEKKLCYLNVWQKLLKLYDYLVNNLRNKFLRKKFLGTLQIHLIKNIFIF